MQNIISRLIDAIALGVIRKERELSNSDIVSMLDEIRESFLQEAEGDSTICAEIERSIAGHKFKILSRRDADFEGVEHLHQEVLSLGFSSLMEEGTVQIYYSQYCIRFKKFQLARPVLEAMLNKAGDPSSGPPRVRKQLATDAGRILKELIAQER